MLFRRIFCALIPAFLPAAAAFCQGQAIGGWRSHYPYNTALSVATDGRTVWTAGSLGFAAYDAVDGSLETWSKVNGLSDVRTTRVGYDAGTGTVVIGYANSNIDLYTPSDGTFRNLPDLRLRSVTGSKTINAIWAEGGRAWVSTDIGVLVLNLARTEVAETYTFGSGTTLPVRDFAALGSFFYVATPAGVYRAPRAAGNLTAFSSWQAVGAVGNARTMAVVDGALYIHADSTVLRLQSSGAGFDTVLRSPRLVGLSAGTGALLVTETYGPYGTIKRFLSNGTQTDSVRVGSPGRALELASGDLYIPDAFGGLVRQKDEGTTGDYIVPEGPNAEPVFEVRAAGGEVLVAHGGYNNLFQPIGSLAGASVRRPDGGWTHYAAFRYGPFGDSTRDVTAILRTSDGALRMGSLGEGLLTVGTDGTFEQYRQAPLQPAFNDPSRYNVLSLAEDAQANLVVGLYAAPSYDFAVRTPAGEWYGFATPFTSSALFRGAAAGLVVDDAGQRWYYGPQGGGVTVYNDGGTPEAPGDDSYRKFFAGAGAGNLPSSTIYSLAKDRSGAIWVGTANGIGIISCASTATTDASCEAEQRVVQYDQFAGFLFEDETVLTIAVDGADRKWIGTSNGLWLISPTGDAVVERFTTGNSPLPSNTVRSVSVDGATGDVYIGTDAGLVSYRGTATDGGPTNDAGFVSFPNPVPSGYRGPVAIRGFTEGADVRITDVAGQLVYRARATGGQVVWNGADYTGRRPQSGVYLVFATNADGTQAGTGKLVFLE